MQAPAVSALHVFRSLVLWSSSHSRWHHMRVYCLFVWFVLVSMSHDTSWSLLWTSTEMSHSITTEWYESFVSFLNVVSDVFLSLKQLTRESLTMKHKRPEVRFPFNKHLNIVILHIKRQANKSFRKKKFNLISRH